MKIRSKIILYMILITTLALALTSLLSYQYFSETYKAEAKKNSADTLQIAGNALREDFSETFRNLIRFLGTYPMTKTLDDIAYQNSVHYFKNYLAIQDDLSALIHSNKRIAAIIMIGQNGEYFSTLDMGQRYAPDEFFNWDLSEVKGITFLAARQSPLSFGGNVLPLVIPVKQINHGTSAVATSVAEATITIMVLFHNRALQDYIEGMNKNQDSVLYLSDERGQALTLTDEAELELTGLVDSHIIQDADTLKEWEQRIAEDTICLSTQPLDLFGLKIINIISKNQLLEGLSDIRYFIVVTWIICTALSILMAIITARHITKPIIALSEVVKQIQEDCYRTRYLYKNHDEIGILSRSINYMYDKIKEQMAKIKQDEQEKTRAEIGILTEQINPHFLYNTLDFIRWETLGHNTLVAADMLENLSTYLRIGLNSGQPFIPIAEEIRHTELYLNMMNLRERQQISFTIHLPKELKSHKILRMILQPLVENSIKHGFPNILNPQINIHVEENEGKLLILVMDNGLGIDIKKAEQALCSKEQALDKHIGLRNIYYRLKMSYGEGSEIKFQSIPRYQNTVEIIIPPKSENP